MTKFFFTPGYFPRLGNEKFSYVSYYRKILFPETYLTTEPVIKATVREKFYQLPVTYTAKFMHYHQGNLKHFTEMKKVSRPCINPGAYPILTWHSFCRDD